MSDSTPSHPAASIRTKSQSTVLSLSISYKEVLPAHPLKSSYWGLVLGLGLLVLSALSSSHRASVLSSIPLWPPWRSRGNLFPILYTSEQPVGQPHTYTVPPLGLPSVPRATEAPCGKCAVFTISSRCSEYTHSSPLFTRL